jgi:murein DD-endopeptidase MepM/ murein hydrolase activator NlpD
VRRRLRLVTPYLRGADVAAVQQVLGRLAVDGIYGPLTAARVREWKRAHDLPGPEVLEPQDQALLLDAARPLDTPLAPHSEFAVRMPPGAPDADGVRYHAAKDWFAPAATPVRAPVAGTVIEARRDSRSAGPVFGGTVKLQDRLGRVWALRHVDPRTAVGRRVRAGEVVASVARWDSGSPHLHVEVWRTLAGGYRYENMIDPILFFVRA